VQLEYKEAVESIGRLTLVCERPQDMTMLTGNGPMSAGDTMVAHNPGGLSERTYIKGNTVLLPLPLGHTVNALAAELINDPEEGSWENLAEANPSFSQRDLKTDSMVRKFSRARVLSDSRYADRFIFDVLPYAPEGLSCERRTSDDILKQLLDDCGRHEARHRLQSGIAYPEYVSHSVPDSEPLRRRGIDRVDAFVLFGSPGWEDKCKEQERERQQAKRTAIESLRESLRGLEEP